MADSKFTDLPVPSMSSKHRRSSYALKRTCSSTPATTAAGPFTDGTQERPSDTRARSLGSHADPVGIRQYLATIYAATTNASPSHRRVTVNSLTAHPACMGPLQADTPQTHIQIPRPPTRAPIAPTRVVTHTRGNRFTEEDKAFFIEHIQWRLRTRPKMSKEQLCVSLARKVRVPSRSYLGAPANSNICRLYTTTRPRGRLSGPVTATSPIRYLTSRSEERPKRRDRWNAH